MQQGGTDVPDHSKEKYKALYENEKIMNKSYILLQMYDVFREGGGIKISDCCGKYQISIATFRRYIAFLRGYFAEVHGKEIIYDAENMQYSIK